MSVSTSISDDYASLDVGELSFYYGYEATVCTKHKDKKPFESCPDEDCDKYDWAFVVTKMDNVVFVRSGKELRKQYRNGLEPPDFLLVGIGLWMVEQETK